MAQKTTVRRPATVNPDYAAYIAACIQMGANEAAVKQGGKSFFDPASAAFERHEKLIIDSLANFKANGIPEDVQDKVLNAASHKGVSLVKAVAKDSPKPATSRKPAVQRQSRSTARKATVQTIAQSGSQFDKIMEGYLAKRGLKVVKA